MVFNLLALQCDVISDLPETFFRRLVGLVVGEGLEYVTEQEEMKKSNRKKLRNKNDCSVKNSTRTENMGGKTDRCMYPSKKLGSAL